MARFLETKELLLERGSVNRDLPPKGSVNNGGWQTKLVTMANTMPALQRVAHKVEVQGTSSQPPPTTPTRLPGTPGVA